MPTEVQTFLTETQRQIDEEGLLGMSGTHFDQGDKPIRVLKAKQYEHRIYSGGMVDMMKKKNRKGKFASTALIAQGLNAMNEAIKNGDFEPLVFNDSDIGSDDEDPTKGCEGCCDFEVCWPDQSAIDRSVKARKLMNRIFAQGARRDHADAEMKKHFYKEAAVKRVKDAGRT